MIRMIDDLCFESSFKLLSFARAGSEGMGDSDRHAHRHRDVKSPHRVLGDLMIHRPTKEGISGVCP